MTEIRREFRRTITARMQSLDTRDYETLGTMTDTGDDARARVTVEYRQGLHAAAIDQVQEMMDLLDREWKDPSP